MGSLQTRSVQLRLFPIVCIGDKFGTGLKVFGRERL